MLEVLLISEVGIDLEGLALRMHCSMDEVKHRLHKNPEAFAREVARNPHFFRFYGEIDLDDLSEPLALGRFLKHQISQIQIKLDMLTDKQKELLAADDNLTAKVDTLISGYNALKQSNADLEAKIGSMNLSDEDKKALQDHIDSNNAKITEIDAVLNPPAAGQPAGGEPASSGQ